MLKIKNSVAKNQLGVIEVQNKKLCFCKKDIMSICTADSENEQKKCKFHKKSSFPDKCMYSMFD
jgi:hypothetical protein